MADVTDIVNYYVNLLIIQYHNQPKAQATIQLMAETLLASGVMFDVQNGYDVNTAVGVQLDVIGKYVGVDRNYEAPDLTGFYSTIIYDQVASPPTQLGMTNYANFVSEAGKVLQYTDLIGGNAKLSDDNFRILIKLAIITNNSNFSHQSIDANLFEIFGDTLRASSLGNMVMFYFTTSALSAIMLAAFQKGLLPKPMGVRIGGIIEQTEDYFGFNSYNGGSPFITGFSTYSDYGTKSGNTLVYDDITTA